MKIIHAISLLTVSFSLSACLSSESGGADEVASTETIRAPVETECRTLGYEAVRALVTDVMQVPTSAMLSNNQTLAQFLATNQDVLGGIGASENRSCSIMYFKAVSQLGMLSCHYASENLAANLFPNGLSDVGTAYFMMTSKNIDSIEQEALNVLSSQITTITVGLNTSLERKRIAAICSSIFSSMATQAL